ncbi:uncharacterized protein LOC110637305 isoform X2 [Hevea brasiliensis]|uniref:uncharacterized protein LOC110637305 isoform X2 n=1 Tax=Hevea brasiliensis TaxID=3981 RepID=UPI0025EB7FC8|nr:uncharacterized protein LOC110637305 isoform X2 [Hevea brasiliensis]
MSSSGIEPEAPDLVCQLDNVQGMVDAFSAVRWKRQQLFVQYEYNAQGRPRFGVSLGLFVDCLNTFSVPGHSTAIEIRYPGPDMQLLLNQKMPICVTTTSSQSSDILYLVLESMNSAITHIIHKCFRSVDSLDACIYAEIRTRIPDTISWDYNFEPAGTTPLSFTVKSAALKEAIDDLEWPGSSIQIILKPVPPSVTFRGEGHGDLQIDFMYYINTDLLIAFHCDHEVSYRYKYKFLRATTSNIPSSVIKDNRGSKLTIGRGGMLKVQHLVLVGRSSISHPHVDSAGYQQPSRIAFIEFFVRPEENEGPIHD